jgi:hypothetical protein
LRSGKDEIPELFERVVDLPAVESESFQTMIICSPVEDDYARVVVGVQQREVTAVDLVYQLTAA